MKTIGMIIPTPDNSFFSNLVSQVERQLKQLGFGMIVCTSENNAEREKEQFRLLENLHVDGILCVSGLSDFPDDLISQNLPVVWLDRVPTSQRRIPWVANDDMEATRIATELLLNKGCTHILLAPGFIAENRNNPRVAGYRSALQNHGIIFSDKCVLNRPGINTSEVETEKLVRHHLEEGGQVDGIITSSDRAAFGAIVALRSVGFYVPEDVRLISFDNSPYAATVSPAITALDRNPSALAQKACEIMLDLIKGKKPEQLEHIIPVSLTERESTR